MDIDTFLEQPGSESSTDDQDKNLLRVQASTALQRWLRDHVEVAGEIKETIRAHIHLQEVERRTQRAEQARQSAEQQCGTLMTKQDPAGHTRFSDSRLVPRSSACLQCSMRSR